MGEAKRRNKLGVSPKLKTSNIDKSVQYPKWLYVTKLKKFRFSAQFQSFFQRFQFEKKDVEKSG